MSVAMIHIIGIALCKAIAAYLPSPIQDPLLCVTVSATFRESTSIARPLHLVLKNALSQEAYDELVVALDKDTVGARARDSKPVTESRPMGSIVEANLLSRLSNGAQLSSRTVLSHFQLLFRSDVR